MNVKNLNKLFGYGYFIIGALKILLVILVLIRLGTNIAVIFNGGSADSDYYSTFSTAIGFGQIILALGSIVMIVANIKKQPGVITGYLYGLGALVIEFVIPPMMLFFFVLVECGLYMKAGSKIKNTNLGYDIENKTSKEMIKNTEWFYSGKNELIENKKPNSNVKSKKEIYESEEISNLTEFDKITYNEETSFIKDNIVTIILIVLIIIIVLSIGMFCWKVIQN